MRVHGKIKLGFYPLPVPEAERLKNCLAFPPEFSALDPCIGDGVAFAHLLEGTAAHRYGIEIDAHRAEQARGLGIETLQANALDVRCPADALSLLYLNPPYDFEIGQTNNQRLEFVFLEHTYRWLKPGGILLFVIPQPQLRPCARLAEWFMSHLEKHKALMPALGIGCTPVLLTNSGIPLDEVEDLLPESAAYRQASRVLLPKQRDVRGRPLTPLHGGHVGLLCTAGMLNGVFGEGEDRHIAHWRSVKFTDHWEEQEEEDGTRILHDRERFSHELTLIFVSGKTQILTHEKKDSP